MNIPLLTDRPSNGDTPLHYGVMSDSFETVRLLLKHAPSEVLSVKNGDGKDPEELAKTLSATEFSGLFAGKIRSLSLLLFSK